MKAVLVSTVFLIVCLFSATAQTIQQRLDAGETPCEIFASGEPVQSLYGKTYQGGLIFYFNTNTGEGLVSRPVDASTGALWGCWMIDIPGAEATAVGSGAQNTADILAECSDPGIAAEIADLTDDGTYADWFLPSKDELDLMYNNLKVNGVGNFSNDYYWSSSETPGGGLAWAQVFGNGDQQTQARFDQQHSVRPVRSFSCQVLPPEIQLLSGGSNLPCGGDFFFPFTEPGNSSDRLLTIRNEGGSTLTVSSLNFTGDPVFDLINPPNLPLLIPPGQQTVLTIRFSPTAVQEVFTGTLPITSNDADEPTCVVNLSATASIPTMGQWAFFFFGLSVFTVLIVGVWNLSEAKKQKSPA